MAAFLDGRRAGAGGDAAARCGLPWDAERVGLATLAVVVIVFGVHSAIDWTWYVPGNAVPALLCAGFVASRTTLRERLAPEAEPAPERRRPAPARGRARRSCW